MAWKETNLFSGFVTDSKNPEEEKSIAEAVEKVKAGIREKDPERLRLYERFYEIGEQYKQLSETLKGRYAELEEDWFNIEDLNHSNEEYQQFITDAEACLLRREFLISNLKLQMSEIGASRFKSYRRMRDEQYNNDLQDFSFLFLFHEGTDFKFLDTVEIEHLEEWLRKLTELDIHEIDEWSKRRTIEEEKHERTRMRAEKARILPQLQRISGKERDYLNLLCLKMHLIEDIPQNTTFLQQLSGTQLREVESKFKELEEKLRRYGLEFYEASESDVAVVLHEMGFQA